MVALRAAKIIVRREGVETVLVSIKERIRRCAEIIDRETAAPDLLAALERIAEPKDDEGSENVAYRQDYEQWARAALNKARGGSEAMEDKRRCENCETAVARFTVTVCDSQTAEVIGQESLCAACVLGADLSAYFPDADPTQWKAK